jgi:hypothetical protein
LFSVRPNRLPLLEAEDFPDTLDVRPVSVVRMNHSVPVESMKSASEQVRSVESSQSGKTPRSEFFTPFTYRQSLPRLTVVHYTAFPAFRDSQRLAQVLSDAEPNCA